MSAVSPLGPVFPAAKTRDQGQAVQRAGKGGGQGHTHRKPRRPKRAAAPAADGPHGRERSRGMWQQQLRGHTLRLHTTQNKNAQ